MGKEYEVEQILSCRIRGGKEQYRIKWKGYPLSEATWENAENLNCDFLLEKFKKSQEVKTPTKRKRPEVKVKTPLQKAYRQSDPKLSDEDDVSVDGTPIKKKPGASGGESSHGPAAKKKKRVTDVTGVSTPTTQKPSASRTPAQQKKQATSNRRRASDSKYIRQTRSMVSSVQNSEDSQKIDESVQNTSAMSSSRVEQGDHSVSQLIQLNPDESLIGESVQKAAPVCSNRGENDAQAVLESSLKNSDESVQKAASASSRRSDAEPSLEPLRVAIQDFSNPNEELAAEKNAEEDGPVPLVIHVVKHVSVPIQKAVQNPTDQLMLEENSDEDVPPLSGIDIIHFMIGQSQTNQNLATPMDEPPVAESLEENPLPLENEAKMGNEIPVPDEGGGDDDDVVKIGEDEEGEAGEA